MLSRRLCTVAIVLALSASRAIAADPPTASTAANTAVPTCGNGHLDEGEICANCAQDCLVHPCTSAGKPRSFDVHFEPPKEMRVSSITVLVGYDSRRVSLPGSAGAETVGKRLSAKQEKAIVVTNDLDYGLRAVFTRPGGIEKGRLFTLAVDPCKGAPPPTTADFGCVIEGCAAASGNVSGCGCRVTAP